MRIGLILATTNPSRRGRIKNQSVNSHAKAADRPAAAATVMKNDQSAIRAGRKREGNLRKMATQKPRASCVFTVDKFFRRKFRAQSAEHSTTRWSLADICSAGNIFIDPKDNPRFSFMPFAPTGADRDFQFRLRHAPVLSPNMQSTRRDEMRHCPAFVAAWLCPDGQKISLQHLPRQIELTAFAATVEALPAATLRAR